MESSVIRMPRTQKIADPQPSASVLLISPTNEVLLLQRVKTASSFASAHVFPGGHVAPQDGELPHISDIRRHEDSRPYRIAAIRETFEESGILLANRRDRPKETLILSVEEREQGRHAIHQNETDFQAWVEQKGGNLDLEHLIPFTRWLTPAHKPKRFTTQMYIYFLPLPSDVSTDSSAGLDTSPYQSQLAVAHTPTPDGGLEHNTADFYPPREWLSLAATGVIDLRPPQFFLLSLIASYLSPPPSGTSDSVGISPDSDIQGQREALVKFIESGDPPWGEKCISPRIIDSSKERTVVALDSPGPELQGTHRKGDYERVLVLKTVQGNIATIPLEVLSRDKFLEQIEREKL